MLNTSRLRIIAIGKIRKKWIQSGTELYISRLPGVLITEIRDSSQEKEAKAIKAAINKGEILIPLTETGDSFTSTQLAKRLEELSSHRIAFAIGGANGLNKELINSSKWSLSLSPMTFPHEIARLLLLEQIYRAQMITQGSPYHRQ